MEGEWQYGGTDQGLLEELVGSIALQGPMESAVSFSELVQGESHSSKVLHEPSVVRPGVPRMALAAGGG